MPDFVESCCRYELPMNLREAYVLNHMACKYVIPSRTNVSNGTIALEILQTTYIDMFRLVSCHGGV